MLTMRYNLVNMLISNNSFSFCGLTVQSIPVSRDTVIQIMCAKMWF